MGGQVAFKNWREVASTNMWETIQQILRKNQGTCIIVEEGKPAFVITRFEDYQKLLEPETNPRPGHRENFNEPELLEKINNEINNWKAKQTENNPETEETQTPEEGELKIENLPVI